MRSIINSGRSLIAPRSICSAAPGAAPNEISVLPPAARPGGDPRNETYEALHAVPANPENPQQTLFRLITSWHEWLVVRHGNVMPGYGSRWVMMRNDKQSSTGARSYEGPHDPTPDRARPCPTVCLVSLLTISR